MNRPLSEIVILLGTSVLKKETKNNWITNFDIEISTYLDCNVQTALVLLVSTVSLLHSYSKVQ